MMFPLRLIPYLLVTSAVAASLKVKVTEGPRRCREQDKVMKGHYVSMHHRGTIDYSSATGIKGDEIDNSRKLHKGKPHIVPIGLGRTMQGWEEGIVGLCKGAKATLIIPPELGYGDHGGPNVPGGATLKYEIEVLDASYTPPPKPSMFHTLDTDRDGQLTKEEFAQYFIKRGGTHVPDDVWEKEDKNRDGIVTWEEFGGPKGDSPMHSDEF